MPVTLEIGYFNSYFLKKLQNNPTTVTYTALVTWDAANNLGSVSSANQDEDWYIEESRIRGGYNNTSTDLGVKAYIVEDVDAQQTRGNSLIYSGVYNSRTGINQTNQFSVAQDITRSVDPVGGTIQKLFAEDTNLVIFQERKVNIALIDKDAIYTAEGQPIQSTSNIVIGQITPIMGNWGIGKNPESFATYGYRKYFVDRDRNAVLRLAGNQINEISNYGMMDFFRDQLSALSNTGAIIGGYDVYNQNYVLSLQTNPMSTSGTYKTLTFDERTQGWTSFYTYKPNWMFSIQGQYYTAYGAKIYKHYDSSVNRNTFYGTSSPSTVKLVLNPEPTRMKTFKTISYEGSSGWEVTSLISDDTGKNDVSGVWTNQYDQTTGAVRLADGTSSGTNYNQIYSYDQGLYSENGINYRAGFDRKQNNYVAVINNNTADPIPGEVIWGNQTMGIKGYTATVTFSTDDEFTPAGAVVKILATDPGGLKELFAVGSEYILK
jgi:hypothetical protein